MSIPDRPSDLPAEALPLACGLPERPSIERCNVMAADRGLGVFTRLLAWHLARAQGDLAGAYMDGAALRAQAAESREQVPDLLAVIEATGADDAARRN